MIRSQQEAQTKGLIKRLAQSLYGFGGWSSHGPQRDARFSANAWLKVWVEEGDLAYTDEIAALKASADPVEAKIEKAKAFARDLAEEKVRAALSESGIAIEYDSLAIDVNRIDWETLVTPEPPEEV